MDEPAQFVPSPLVDLSDFQTKCFVWCFVWPLVCVDALTYALNLYRGDQASLLAGRRNIDRVIADMKSRIE